MNMIFQPPGTDATGQRLEFAVSEMTCASCVRRVEKAILAVPGVKEATVNLATERAQVSMEGSADAGAVAAAMARAGYQVEASAVDLAVEGMTCASCVGRVERALSRVPDVLGAQVNLAAETARVQVAGTSPGALVEAIERAGYKARLVVQGAAGSEKEADSRRAIAARRETLHLAAAAAAAAAVLTAPLLLPMLGSLLGAAAMLPG